MLVSVIMPTYNCGRFIEETVRSVLAQTVTDWELLIVDDGGTDNTRAVLAPYLARCPNIRYHCLPGNRGPAAARNKALDLARGKYIAFLDSDDLWHPDKLKKQIAFMERTGAPFSCTAYEQMDEAGRRLGVVCIPPERTDYRKMIRLSNPIGNLTVMYDRERLGEFRVPDIRKRNDFALWLQILRRTEFCYGMPEALGTYRVRKDSVSSNKLGQAGYHWQLYRDIEGHSIPYCLWAMACWAWVKGTGIGLNRKKT